MTMLFRKSVNVVVTRCFAVYLARNNKQQPLIKQATAVDLQLVSYFVNLGVSSSEIEKLKRKNKKLVTANIDKMKEVLELLETYGIDKYTVITKYPSILTSKPLILKEYATVLKECGFDPIQPEHLINYFSIMKTFNIRNLKKYSYLSNDINVYKCLCECFKLWKPMDCVDYESSTIFTLRLEILQKYLEWRLSITKEKFLKIIGTYNRFYYRPLAKMEESINIAEDILKMSKEKILKNPFIIAADPVNTMKIITELKYLNGIEAVEALNKFTFLFKKDYNDLKKIDDIFKKYETIHRGNERMLPLYLYSPTQITKRLKEISTQPDLNVFVTNKRFPVLVEYKNLALRRHQSLMKMDVKCASLHSLIKHSKIPDNMIYKFSTSDVIQSIMGKIDAKTRSGTMYESHLRKNLSVHAYYRDVSLKRIVKNMETLLKRFNHTDILNNCQLLLYSAESINKYLPLLLNLRENHQKQRFKQTKLSLLNKSDCDFGADINENNDITKECLKGLNGIQLNSLTDSQLLSLVLYFIENKFAFSDDGVWDYGKIQTAYETNL